MVPLLPAELAAPSLPAEVTIRAEGVRGAEVGMPLEWGVRGAEVGVRRAEVGVRRADVGVRGAEVGV